MKTFEIKHRFTDAVLFKGEGETLRQVVLQAIASRADLADADLADADLARADLADADLAGANLARANLARADLADADLARADLADANLADADLAGANLADADLAGANLAGANLARADLAGANLADADLAGANLADADLAGANLARANLADARNLPAVDPNATPPEPYKRAVSDEERKQRAAARAQRYRERHPEVPVVEALDKRILARITDGVGELHMGAWHSCETTHCRAGWAITLAGEGGKKLEDEHGPHRAGMMIYRASTGRVPHFFASNEDALADIKACAEAQS